MSRPPIEAPAPPFVAAGAGVRVRVRLSPRAAADRIGDAVDDGRGGRLLKVAVTAPPVDGRANAALIDLLARAWRLPKGALAIDAGAGAKTKTITIDGPPDALLPALNRWWAAHVAADGSR
jgi:hypothetical protein